MLPTISMEPTYVIVEDNIDKLSALISMLHENSTARPFLLSLFAIYRTLILIDIIFIWQVKHLGSELITIPQLMHQKQSEDNQITEESAPRNISLQKHTSNLLIHHVAVLGIIWEGLKG